MIDLENVRLYLNIAASLTTLIAFLGIGLKPVRTRISTWMADLFTADIKQEMVVQIAGVKSELAKDRALGTSRHRSNTRELKKITTGLKTVNNRIDEHLAEEHP